MSDIQLTTVKKIKDYDNGESLFRFHFIYKNKKGYHNFRFPTNFLVDEYQITRLRDHIEEKCLKWAKEHYKF